MSANCNITNTFLNSSQFSFTPNANSSLSSGNWVISPQPIPAGGSVVAFQAIGVAGTATGAVGQAGYNVFQNGTQVGMVTLTFSDPYSGNNGASVGSNNVPGLSIAVSCPEHGSTITAEWSAS